MVPARDDLPPQDDDALLLAVLDTPAHELAPLLDHPDLDESRLLLLLRRGDVGAPILRTISERNQWMSSYLVKSALVLHPHTPRVIGLNLVKFLYWRDLVRVVGNLKVDAGVRRLAEVTLRDRLQEISLGERIALARMAPREVIKFLRVEQNEQVVQALLTNSRLGEDDVLSMAQSLRTPTNILIKIVLSEKWMARTQVRLALLRNPKIPPEHALTLLRRLPEPDLLGLIDSPQVGHATRAAAARVLHDKRQGHPASDCG